MRPKGHELRTDPYKLISTASTLSPAVHDRLHAILTHLEKCHSAAVCRQATRQP